MLTVGQNQLNDIFRDHVKHKFRGMNVLIGDNITMDDIELFFGPVPHDEVFLECDEDIRFPQLLKLLGIFKSTGQARKNGWDKDIDEGWTCFRIGKLKTEICILKLTRPKE